MKAFTEPLKKLAEYDEIRKKITVQSDGVMVSGCIDSQKAHFIYTIGAEYKNRLIITSDELKAKELYEDYRFFDKNVYYYPAKDFIFFGADVHGNLIIRNRLNVIEKIILEDNFTVVTTIDALADYVTPIDIYKNNTITIDETMSIDLDELKKQMLKIGYTREVLVEQPGQYAVRGGIIDIFPFTADNPYRIELFGDEIDTIKIFDIESQRSVENVSEFRVFPATEMICDEDRVSCGIDKIKGELDKQYESLKKLGKGDEARRLKSITEENINEIDQFHSHIHMEKYVKYFMPEAVNFLDYFEKEDTLLIVDEPNRLQERMAAVEYEYKDSIEQRLSLGYLLPGQTGVFKDEKQIMTLISERKYMIISTLEYNPSDIAAKNKYSINAKAISSYNGRTDMLINDLKKYKKMGYSVVLMSGSRMRADRVAKELRDYELNAFYSENLDKEIVQGDIVVTYGTIRKGFEYPALKFAVIAETDIFGQGKKEKKTKKKYSGASITDLNDIHVGDYVVHENHGLGIYKGIQQMTVDGIERDYITIDYAGSSKLYIDITQLDKIQKYANADAEKIPKLNKLGGQEWSKTKSRVKIEIDGIAKDLVQLYAQRQRVMGYSYSMDTLWQKEFEDLFPYDETEDQKNAINDVKQDMESSKTMDRLICGDVGYGKTEVAIRAAFKAVQEGKQVVYLCPTTILAGQHYANFAQRMKDFPVNIELLSRFRTNKQIKEAIAGAKDGRVDIIIGTHRALSKDVEFKDLGLLIIDEEQRFGVRHKEKIKQLKLNVDVLTLTATPIPRTLHMSLIGIRDMSVLEEPPQDRQPIQTFVTQYDEILIREAINREMARNGQVYYVFNRVRDIEDMTARIQALVPQANVAYAHGQMDEKKIEAIMYDFINGDIDVLVSTTIIETGLDIPNVNTMIIHDADKFGLSQLYQLRGRVGRSNRTAYAFLLYKRDRMLNEVAEKRLEAIKEFSDLGSGFKIAMKDLEIRGAGNILGAVQHGHMVDIGYDLYCKMLNESVKKLKGEVVEEDFETTIDISIDAYIPSSYIINESQKLDVYKKIAALKNAEEASDVLDELIDRFGTPPTSVQNLIKVATIKAIAHRGYVTQIKGNAVGMKITLKPDAKINVAMVPKLVEEYNGQLRFTTGKEPYYTFVPRRKCKMKEMMEHLEELVYKLEEMSEV